MKEYVKKSTVKALRSRHKKIAAAYNRALTGLMQIRDTQWSSEQVNPLKHIARTAIDESMRMHGNRLTGQDK